MRKRMLALVVVALIGMPVAAQFRGFGPMDGTALLSMKSVQEELKLTKEQMKELADANEELQKAVKTAREDMDFSGIAKAQQEHSKAVKKVLDKLDTKQAKRMTELEFQAATK